jgi:hypothetical protein
VQGCVRWLAPLAASRSGGAGVLAFVGNEGSQYQLLALGAVLVFAALLNGLTNRRYGAR